ncbi:peptide-methionine (R)-S-oxide reductase MsrB [Amphritea japonica]|uniref:Peptide methionine sulfoxide reductase MsrB n=1 Tax=Amphritea japonica ATCC BAA-1530 TaxID=1278309 RepID=A0A7R6PNB1_9GAMM|nr:peptide-methionine (R)-S-oxide reductase MsrB [Amphritea japonica]BBB26533.1 peptide-methionine (R)-S-oxide reductase [Amphritea japonica ATCC BAA-1530]
MAGDDFKVKKTDSQWRDQLTPEQYYVCREKGTERPGTGKYDQHFNAGEYHCVACGEKLFESESKFDAGCGWPSFDAPAESDNIKENADSSHGMIRTEVVCNSCGAHLGHLFPDGPTQTGMRYCINSVSIDFSPEEDGE